MKEKRKEKNEADEFIAGILEKEEPAELNEIGDGELFGKEIFEKEKEEPMRGIDVPEYGKEIRVPKEAVMAFAKAMGKDAGEIIEIYQKGCCFDELMCRFTEAKRDSDAFEKIAGIRGIGKEEMKKEIFGVLEKARLEKSAMEIMENNPGMNRETAEELAKFRIEAKGLEKKEKGKNPEQKKIRNKLREIDVFMTNHAPEEIETLDNSIIDEWESGIPLEKAFGSFMLMQENRKLLEEIERMKQGKAVDDQRNYAREHSAGSVYSSAQSAKLDEFIEGLFKEY